MAFLSINDEEFWGHVPEDFKHIAGEGSMEGISISVYELGKAEDDAPVMTALHMAPGYRLPRHAHDCFRLEVIMQGSMDVGDGRILKTGAVMMSEPRSEEHTSELQSLMRISYAVFCLKNKNKYSIMQKVINNL